MERKLNLMVPVDFTPASYKAIEFLGLLMDKTPLDTHLVHVIQVNAADWSGTSEASETIDRKEMHRLEQKAEQQFAELKEHVDFTFTSEILHGGLTTSLSDYANAIRPDLVIMGTEGAEGWHEKLSGSEAQHVVRHIHVPVITIHQHAAITPIHNILWVADFETERQPEQSVNNIKYLQQLFGAKLHLLQIIPQEDEPNVERIQESMQRFASQLGLQNYELHLHRDYKIPTGISNFNRESEMDLVVIGTHARKGFRHIFYGSIAEALVNRCIRPLLTYHLN